LPRWLPGCTRKRIGTACFRSASNSGSPSRARSCKRRIFSSLDEPAEAALYRLLHERLKNATIVSIGHRATLAAFHRRRIALSREGEGFRLREAALAPAAE